MNHVRITHCDHPINWWSDEVGTTCEVIEEFPETGYLRIKFVRHESQALSENTYYAEGNIPKEFVEYVGGVINERT